MRQAFHEASSMTGNKMMPTDFLSRLVTKARGDDSAIAPRLPSLFEPISPAEIAIPVDMPEPAAPQEVAHEPRTIAPESRPERKEQDAPRREGQPLTIHRVELALAPVAAVAPREVERTTADGQEAPPGSLVPVPSLVPTVMPSPHGEPLTEDVAPTVVETMPRHEEEPRARTTGPAPREQPAFVAGKTRIVQHVETLSRERRDTAPEPPQPDHHESPAQVGVLVPQGFAVSAPRAAQAAPQMPLPGSRRELAHAEPNAEQPTPVINVTIGRVEVRAVQGAAARPRTDPSKPKSLSLDDYLKQRGGGR
jgi:hypothetical protein